MRTRLCVLMSNTAGIYAAFHGGLVFLEYVMIQEISPPSKITDWTKLHGYSLKVARRDIEINYKWGKKLLAFTHDRVLWCHYYSIVIAAQDMKNEL